MKGLIVPMRQKTIVNNNLDIETILKEMTFEEKCRMLSGGGSLNSFPIERLGIKAINFADGPHGVRILPESNATHFPSLCNLGCSWSIETAREMGRALAEECIHNNISVLLGPGINIKRHILCGRNFEYLSEDPVLSGEIAAGYIDGLQEMGISACLKHYAVNNQEEHRVYTSVEIDERTLREIYLKGFEIAVKKSAPDSVMCAYNKVNAIWCSEHRQLLSEILKNEWKYGGTIISDWGAVHNIARAINAGLDLEMPLNSDIVEQLRKGVDEGLVSVEDIDNALKRVLKLVDRQAVVDIKYDRNKQHQEARRIASDGIVLLKNDRDVLPITSEKYKKIAVVGEYAISPLISGQGSAEVLQSEEYTDIPFDELKKQLPDIEFKYLEMYKKSEFSNCMLWPKLGQFRKEIEDCDLVLFFAGSMLSEDTEKFDRRTAYINPNFEMFIEYAASNNKKVVVVLQNGGALILGEKYDKVDSILEMWLAGEAAGGAIADVLCGTVNPSGKLAETFPKTMRKELEYPGNGMFVEYTEKMDVGYRYYDKHPNEIAYPFGHGLSYTVFEYENIIVDDKKLTVEISLENTGKYDGSEVVQLYIGDSVSTVVRPIKELKKFKKVFLKAGEKKQVKFMLTPEDFSYYNVSLHQWVAENGIYKIYIGSSSRDIRLSSSMVYSGDMPYSVHQVNEDMIG